MLNNLKSLTKDATYVGIGALGVVAYVTYTTGKRIVNDVPVIIESAKDTYNEVKDVLDKSNTKDQ